MDRRLLLELSAAAGLAAVLILVIMAQFFLLPLRDSPPAAEYSGDLNCEVLNDLYAAVYEEVDRRALCRRFNASELRDYGPPIDPNHPRRLDSHCFVTRCLDFRFYGTWESVNPNYYTWLVINQNGLIVEGLRPDGKCGSSPAVVRAPDQLAPPAGSNRVMRLRRNEGQPFLSITGDQTARFRQVDERDICRKEDGTFLEGAASLNSFADQIGMTWSRHNASEVAKLYSESVTLEINDEPVLAGRKSVEGAVQSIMTAYPDLVVKFDHLELKGDRVLYHWTFIGTNSGPGGTGNRVRISGYEDWKIGPDWLITDAKRHYNARDWERQVRGAPH